MGVRHISCLATAETKQLTLPAFAKGTSAANLSGRWRRGGKWTTARRTGKSLVFGRDVRRPFRWGRYCGRTLLFFPDNRSSQANFFASVFVALCPLTTSCEPVTRVLGGRSRVSREKPPIDRPQWSILPSIRRIATAVRKSGTLSTGHVSGIGQPPCAGNGSNGDDVVAAARRRRGAPPYESLVTPWPGFSVACSLPPVVAGFI